MNTLSIKADTLHLSEGIRKLQFEEQILTPQFRNILVGTHCSL